MNGSSSVQWTSQRSFTTVTTPHHWGLSRALTFQQVRQTWVQLYQGEKKWPSIHSLAPREALKSGRIQFLSTLSVKASEWSPFPGNPLTASAPARQAESLTVDLHSSSSPTKPTPKSLCHLCRGSTAAAPPLLLLPISSRTGKSPPTSHLLYPSCHPSPQLQQEFPGNSQVKPDRETRRPEEKVGELHIFTLLPLVHIQVPCLTGSSVDDYLL